MNLIYIIILNFNNITQLNPILNLKFGRYFKMAGNLTEVMIRGAGHMVPADKPQAALGLISAFARGIALYQDTGSLVSEKKSLRTRLLPVN